MTWQINDMASRLANEFSPGEIVLVNEDSPVNLWDHIPVENAVVVICANGVVGAGPQPRIMSSARSLPHDRRRAIGLQDWGSIVEPYSVLSLLQGGRIDTVIIDAVQIDHSGSIVLRHIDKTDYRHQNLGVTVDQKRPVIIAVVDPEDEHSEYALQSSCELPTSIDMVVNMVITKHGLFAIQNDSFQLLDLAPDVDWEHLTSLTDAKFTRRRETTERVDNASSDCSDGTLGSDLFKEDGKIVATSPPRDTNIIEE